jgi:hypothetical protein
MPADRRLPPAAQGARVKPLQIVTPAVRATMRARQAGDHGRRATVQQWAAHLTVALAAAWVAHRLDELIERRLSRPAA